MTIARGLHCGAIYKTARCGRVADLVESLSTIIATLSILGAVAFFLFRSWRSYTPRSLFGRWISFHYTYDEGKKELIERPK